MGIVQGDMKGINFEGQGSCKVVQSFEGEDNRVEFKSRGGLPYLLIRSN